MPQVYYKGAIWTNHALQRLQERGFTQDIAGYAFNNPDESSPGRETGTTIYKKRIDKSLVTIVAKKNEKGEWLILSCWADPPIKGSDDDNRKKAYKSYQSASGWQKIWITIKQQLGISKY